MRVLSLTLACLAALTGEVLAQAIEPGKEGELANVLAPKPGARICYGRSYDAAHLKAHPRQTVTDMQFRLTYYAHEPDESYKEGQRNYYFELRAKLRGAQKWNEAFGECSAAADGSIVCGVDCDGGGVAVKRRDPDRLLVYFDEIARIRMAGCDGDDEGDGVELTPGADDKEFLLGKLGDAECPAYDDW